MHFIADPRLTPAATPTAIGALGRSTRYEAVTSIRSNSRLAGMDRAASHNVTSC